MSKTFTVTVQSYGDGLHNEPSPVPVVIPAKAGIQETATSEKHPARRNV